MEEVLTAIKGFDEARPMSEGTDIVSYIENKLEETDKIDDAYQELVDNKIDWPSFTVVKLSFDQALDCLQQKRNRPKIQEVLKKLNEMYSSYID